MIKYLSEMKRSILLITCLLISTTIFCQKKDKALWQKAQNIHEKALTVDTHCDTPWALLKTDFDISKKHEAPKSRVDLPRMKEGGLDAMFFAVFTGQKPRIKTNYTVAYRAAHEMIDSIHSMVNQNANIAELALTAGDLSKIEKKGKRAIYIGMENGFPIAKDLSRIEEFYKRGVRYITLCHSSHNDICDSSSDTETPEHNGVSEFGKDVIAEMNRLGMLIDVSHASDKSFYDIVQFSKAPIIASHSSVRSVCNHDRNMSDEMLIKLADNGGVIQICLLDVYVKEPDTTKMRYQIYQKIDRQYKNRNNLSKAEIQEMNDNWDFLQNNYQDQLPTVADLVDHIDYVVNLVGVDYVGIGSDFDGGGGLADCADVSQFPNITFELLKRGYSKEDILKIWGGNIIRVFNSVETISER